MGERKPAQARLVPGFGLSSHRHGVAVGAGRAVVSRIADTGRCKSRKGKGEWDAERSWTKAVRGANACLNAGA